MAYQTLSHTLCCTFYFIILIFSHTRSPQVTCKLWHAILMWFLRPLTALSYKIGYLSHFEGSCGSFLWEITYYRIWHFHWFNGIKLHLTNCLAEGSSWIVYRCVIVPISTTLPTILLHIFPFYSSLVSILYVKWLYSFKCFICHLNIYSHEFTSFLHNAKRPPLKGTLNWDLISPILWFVYEK